MKNHKQIGKAELGGFSFKITECSCGQCRAMCSEVCFPTPEEARKLIDRGYSARLEKREHETVFGETWFVLAPRSTKHVCTFFDQNKNCILHDKGIKPLEARIVSCKRQKNEDLIRELVCEEWLQPEGRELISEWESRTGLDIEDQK
jgi:hypothetical protein